MWRFCRDRRRCYLMAIIYLPSHYSLRPSLVNYLVVFDYCRAGDWGQGRCWWTTVHAPYELAWVTRMMRDISQYSLQGQFVPLRKGVFFVLFHPVFSGFCCGALLVWRNFCLPSFETFLFR